MEFDASNQPIFDYDVLQLIAIANTDRIIKIQSLGYIIHQLPENRIVRRKC